MAKTYFTITGTNYFHGSEFLKKGMIVKLEKEPDNVYDKEAILVKLEGAGAIGHVANSVKTVKGDSISAGRLYDKIGDIAYGKILFVMPDGVVCRISKKSLLENEKKSGKKKHRG